MSTPFTFQGTLSFPPDTGAPQEPIAVNFSASYDQLAASIHQLVGTGTKDIDFGSIDTPGAKLVLVKVDAGSTVQPVKLRWNAGGSSGEQEVSPGGFAVIGSAAPVAGLTALTVVYASNVTLRVWVLGWIYGGSQVDIADLAIHALVSVVSAAAGVTVAAWKLSAQLQKLRSEGEERQRKVEQLDKDMDALTKENHQSWLSLNYTLGQIAQAMGLAPPMRPPQQSRPGP
jgi:hypothetical protein